MISITKSYIADAVLCMIIGLLLIFRSAESLVFFIRAFGAVLAVMGIVKVLSYLLEKEKRNTLSLCLGIIMIICSVVFLLKPDIFVGIFPFVAGIFIGYGALVSLVEAIKKRAAVPIILSLVVFALAVLVILRPAFISKILIQVIGVSMIIGGVAILMAVKKAQPVTVEAQK